MKEKIIIDALLKDKIPVFISNIKKYCFEMMSLAETGDFEAVKRIAHNIKGAGGGYGFDYISQKGLEVENAAELEDLKAVKKACLEVANYFDLVLIEYE